MLGVAVRPACQGRTVAWQVMAPSPPHGPAGFAVVDVETTGRGQCPPERIVEIAAVRVDPDGTVRDEFDTLLRPDRPVTATWVHSIPDRLLADAPRFADVAGDLAALLEGATLVGHNADFDVGFLRAEFALAGLALPAVACCAPCGLSGGCTPAWAPTGWSTAARGSGSRVAAAIPPWTTPGPPPNCSGGCYRTRGRGG